MIPNLSYVLKLYKNPVDAKSTLIRSTSIACLEMFFSFPIIRPPSGISPSVYNLLWFLPKDPANTLKATVSVCSSILLANSVWLLDESKLCQLTKPQFEYDEIVPPILKSGSLLTKAYELFLILPARSWIFKILPARPQIWNILPPWNRAGKILKFSKNCWPELKPRRSILDAMDLL